MKRTKLAKSTKLSAEKIRKKAVTLAKKIIRTQKKFTCEYCGKSEPFVATHGAHVYEERTYRAMSADLDNILCLCFTHHLGSWNAKEPSWHGSPMEMIDWFKETYPERYIKLKLRAREKIQEDATYWTAKLTELTAI